MLPNQRNNRKTAKWILKLVVCASHTKARSPSPTPSHTLFVYNMKGCRPPRRETTPPWQNTQEKKKQKNKRSKESLLLINLTDVFSFLICIHWCFLGWPHFCKDEMGHKKSILWLKTVGLRRYQKMLALNLLNIQPGSWTFLALAICERRNRILALEDHVLIAKAAPPGRAHQLGPRKGSLVAPTPRAHSKWEICLRCEDKSTPSHRSV